MLLDRGWHLAVCVTDLPLQTARRPVIAHVSATHGVAVLSMPALGPVSVRKRTAETIVRLVGHILGDLAQAEGAAGRLPLAEAVTRRMRELGARTERGEHGVGFVARVVTGNIWLLLGMLRANRPWRLALRLMRVLAVAFAAGVFALGDQRHLAARLLSRDRCGWSSSPLARFRPSRWRSWSPPGCGSAARTRPRASRSPCSTSSPRPRSGSAWPRCTWPCSSPCSPRRCCSCRATCSAWSSGTRLGWPTR